MRHGKAVKLSEAGSDEERWLTEEGKKDIKLTSNLIPFRPKIIYTSPLRRARETAKIVSDNIGGKIKILDELRPGVATCESIRDLVEESESIIIGHAPSIELIVSCIIGGGNIKIQAGGFALVETEEIERGMGTLLELISPRLIRTKVNKIKV